MEGGVCFAGGGRVWVGGGKGAGKRMAGAGEWKDVRVGAEAWVEGQRKGRVHGWRGKVWLGKGEGFEGGRGRGRMALVEIFMLVCL